MNDQWCVIELMGHVRTGGKVSEVEQFGVKMARVEIPTGPDSWVTQFVGGAAIYRLTPCGETEARAVAARNIPQPVHAWEMPRPGLPGRESDSIFEDSPEGPDDKEDDR